MENINDKSEEIFLPIKQIVIFQENLFKRVLKKEKINITCSAEQINFPERKQTPTKMIKICENCDSIVSKH